MTTEKDENNEPYVQGIIHNITDLKKAQRANLQAEKLNTANRLIQTLAHEVRGPLNNISLSMEEINGEDSLENIRTYLDIIKRNATRINDLISELLQSSQSDQVSMDVVSLQDILNQTLENASDRVILKKIKVHTTYPEVPALIAGNAKKLNIAFLNIIINATEAISHENGALEIVIEEEKSRYNIVVKDNGSGISDENLNHLFEPYFTSKRNGLGLGLPATLSILQSHKSNIDVKTKLEEGTTFIISFPKHDGLPRPNNKV